MTRKRPSKRPCQGMSICRWATISSTQYASSSSQESAAWYAQGLALSMDPNRYEVSEPELLRGLTLS